MNLPNAHCVLFCCLAPVPLAEDILYRAMSDWTTRITYGSVEPYMQIRI